MEGYVAHLVQLVRVFSIEGFSQETGEGYVESHIAWLFFISKETGEMASYMETRVLIMNTLISEEQLHSYHWIIGSVT